MLSKIVLALLLLPMVALADNRLKVAVMDTGLDLSDPRFAGVLCDTGHQDFTGSGISDTIGHGTHVAGLIAKSAPEWDKYCLVILKVFPPLKDTPVTNRALEYIKANKIPLVNESLSGGEPNDEEKALMASSGAVIVVAAGNENVPAESVYPSGYALSNVFVVGNWDCAHNKREIKSNYGPTLIWRCGTNIVSTLPHGKTGTKTGTSMAAPLYTAELIERMIKDGTTNLYPSM